MLLFAGLEGPHARAATPPCTVGWLGSHSFQLLSFCFLLGLHSLQCPSSSAEFIRIARPQTPVKRALPLAPETSTKLARKEPFSRKNTPRHLPLEGRFLRMLGIRLTPPIDTLRALQAAPLKRLAQRQLTGRHGASLSRVRCPLRSRQVPSALGSHTRARTTYDLCSASRAQGSPERVAGTIIPLLRHGDMPMGTSRSPRGAGEGV